MRRTIAWTLSLALATSSVSLAATNARAEDKPEAPAASRGTNPLVYVGFAVAGLGLISGALFGADSLQATNSAKESCVEGRCPPRSFDFIDQANRSAWISNISFGVALIGVGVGIYGLVTPPSAPGAEPPPAKKKKGTEAPSYHPAPPGISLNVGPGSVLLRGEF